MKGFFALALSGSLVVAEWRYYLNVHCYEGTNCILQQEPNKDLTLDETNECLNESKCSVASVRLLESEGGQFAPAQSAACTMANDGVQVLDPKGFFVHLDVENESVDSNKTLTAHFEGAAVDECELKLDFLPLAVTGCATTDDANNKPFATQTITAANNKIEIDQIFKAVEGKAVKVTATDKTKCGDGLTGISFEQYTDITLTGFDTGAAASSMAVGGLVAAAAAILWWS